MKNVLLVIFLVVTVITCSNAQSDTIKAVQDKPIKYSLKTNPFSIRYLKSYKLLLEQSISRKISLEYEFGFRNETSSRSRELNAKYGSIRSKYYVNGKIQSGLYIGIGGSYELVETKQIQNPDWESFSVASGFVDFGGQLELYHVVIEMFYGMGIMNEAPSAYKRFDFGNIYGTHYGFSNGLTYRLGIRLGFAI